MRTEPEVHCPNCGADGTALHAGVRDLLYGAPGLWSYRRCANARCGALWLDPRPTRDDLGIAYATYHTHHADSNDAKPEGALHAARRAFVDRRLGYPSQPSPVIAMLSRLFAWFPERREAALYGRFYLPWMPGGRLLEIGCGSGTHLAAMARAGWNASGIDFDPVAIAVALSRGLDAHVGDVRDLSFETGTFDAIVMAQVLEHVIDPVGLLARCAELLKPGGRLVSITPNAESLGHRRFGPHWRGLEPPRHLCIYTRAASALACERAGLRVERIRVTARDAANLLLASERIRDGSNATRVNAPARGDSVPLRLRLLAFAERVANRLGLAWGEELVVSARRPT